MLTERAAALGWSEAVIIDEDLGKSASYDSERSGFQRLVTWVGMADVGIVISFEATRLARNTIAIGISSLTYARFLIL